MDKTLLLIKQAEDKADKTISGAQKKAQGILDNSHTQLAQLEEQKQKEANKHQTKLRKKKEKEILEKREKIIKDADEQIKQLQKNAKKQLDDAVEYMITQFKEEVMK